MLEPRPFPEVEGVTEPLLTLEQVLGAQGKGVVKAMEKAGQLVFHAVGDTGNTRGPTDQSAVADKMVSNGKDSVTFESYDDQDFGYLRILVSAQLHIEYHPASDGADAKTPDDFVTVELATRTLIHFVAQ